MDARKLHRKKHKNSRLGCPQCKERRIKCDETLPSCLKCLSKPMRCGYLDYPPNELEFIHQQHLEAADVPHHLRYFIPQHSQPGQLPPQTHDHHLQFHPVMPPGPALDLWGPMWPPLGQSMPMPMPMQMQMPQYHHPQYHQLPQPQHQHPPPPATTASSISKAPSEDPATVSQRSSPAVPYSTTTNTTNTVRSQSCTITASSRTGTPGFAIANTPRGVLQDGIYNLEASASPEDTTSAKDTHSPENMQWPELLNTSNTGSNLKPSRIGDIVSVPLIQHPDTQPQFNPRKQPEYFGETMTTVYGRVFVLREAYERFVRACTDSGTFDLMVLFGYGIMNNTQPWLQPNFLRRRGDAMRLLSDMVNNITDDNAAMLLNMASGVTRTSIHLQELSLKNYMTLSWGPAVVITKGLENPEAFPKSMYALRRYAEGLVFTSRTVYYPVYTGLVFVEFLEVIKEFGEKYITNEDFVDTDDPLLKNYNDLVAFVTHLKKFTQEEKSDKHVLMYPVEGLYSILKQWFKIYPTLSYTINSKMSGYEKVFYSFWHALTSILEAVFAGGRYLFTYLFNGFIDLMIMDVNALRLGLDDDLQAYCNYSCRIIAFLNRRRQYIIRNTVLNDPMPSFTTQVDRFKTRPMEIHESFITEFRKTVIKPYHYPSEAVTSVTEASAGELNNYYKAGAPESADTAAMVDLFKGLEHEVTPKEEDETVNLLNVNTTTGMLNNDYDPRYTDPTFNEIVNYQPVDVQFMKRYLEDRKEILHLDN